MSAMPDSVASLSAKPKAAGPAAALPAATLPDAKFACPVDAVLRLLMGPWTTYILYVLRNQGPRRFGELKREISGISAKVLTERLRMLEEARLVHRDYRATIPPQVTYSLAPRGEELNPMLDMLHDVALRWRREDAP
ncbi:helix-turn-helix domain-containing protein, partial [Ferrovibrio sp.]|uniref:winged helix-turn-helix transcriptional regulator n=1 Tax=Ferrovibrio sp. TaxID=1917215 RepID=UPI002622FFB3